MFPKHSVPSHAASTPAACVVKTRAFAAFVFLVILLSFASASRAQFAKPGELPKIDAATRAAIVDSITAAIDSVYVLEEPAKRIVAGLR